MAHVDETIPAPVIAGTAVRWYRTQRVTAILQSTAFMLVSWLTVSLATNVWDWKTGLALPILGNILVVLNDWRSPTNIGPIAILNKNNAPPKQG